ncbi:MAG: hypothetical protein EBU90_18000 [Proteobacteria bacterium]|nr:hypothetical protein [Pseudomonadota bacterium]NBP15423.1 hypothetical protein [bacterium]
MPTKSYSSHGRTRRRRRINSKGAPTAIYQNINKWGEITSTSVVTKSSVAKGHKRNTITQTTGRKGQRTTTTANGFTDVLGYRYTKERKRKTNNKSLYALLFGTVSSSKKPVQPQNVNSNQTSSVKYQIDEIATRQEDEKKQQIKEQEQLKKQEEKLKKQEEQKRLQEEHIKYVNSLSIEDKFKYVKNMSVRFWLVVLVFLIIQHNSNIINYLWLSTVAYFIGYFLTQSYYRAEFTKEQKQKLYWFPVKWALIIGPIYTVFDYAYFVFFEYK